MIRLFLGTLLAVALVGPASAHKLKVFATVEGGAITGYAFFIGGGRPEGSSWVAKDAQGAQIAAGETDAEGRFVFDVPNTVASDVTVTVDTHEAHIASATVSAMRFGVLAPAAASVVSDAEAPQDAPNPSLTDRQIAALVDAAVQRQVEPLLERIEQMDSRLRFVDILSGLFFIAGLAGMAMWARSRRK